ncbi:MAG: type II secretion system protein M [Synergistaceae bacterium]|nr:type II secretion system protein M [Synergistaceae bacterium]
MDSIRSILRGETAGSVRFVAAFLAMLIVWVLVWTVYGWNVQARSALTSQQGRLGTLLLLADEYKTLSPSASSQPQNVDVAAVFAQVSENMQLGSRVNRITPDGRNQSVEINRLYAEELAELQKQLASRGVKFIAAELRALPSGRERLLTVSAVIGPIS